MLPQERPLHLRHTFVLKTYRGTDAKDQYTAEREAFMRLRYDSKPIPFVIAYYGSFIDQDTYNIILEYADKGNLEKFLKSTRKPSTKEEVIEFWDRFCSITHGLAHIHGIPSSVNPGKAILMGYVEMKRLIPDLHLDSPLQQLAPRHKACKYTCL